MPCRAFSQKRIGWIVINLVKPTGWRRNSRERGQHGFPHQAIDICGETRVLPGSPFGLSCERREPVLKQAHAEETKQK
jgi:hypothetical protein